ncbi:FKBP-type peptidyl-prolyl cis-trans isomerase [Spirosoma validum]|uniref:Peptidyl-prolyl cis-trans isomerase n=1 Tax=Spirosoma validum TaxID=2771355 RepID=A0A927AXN4_9BACT|nr:FKBP-type peptidyl-prolyl cis-trans isomerase [Spirosoma validum]MBD2751700.1 FKBP-type peptidyl-prolyl cis-trans isomerase [Spirosoma validum]
MRKLHSFIFGALALGTIAACTNNIDPSTDTNAIYQSNLADISTYAASKGLNGKSTNTGLYYAISKPSNSSIATAIGQEVELNYTLYSLTKSTGNPSVIVDRKVDSTYATTSLYGPLTESNSGLIEGLMYMHEGDQAVLLLPSLLAFGNQSAYNGLVPANSPVRFDVTLKRARTEDQQINEYMTANKLTPTEVTSSGLRFIKTLDNSTGATPTATQTLIVKYKGKLLRSVSAFDSTGTGTYPTTIGKSIAGFDEGLSKLKVGEKATIILPSKIGYGTTGYQQIPPYAPMRFDIELVSVQ